MRRILLALLFTALAPCSAFSQEKAAEQPALRFEEVVDNLDAAKNTDLHVKEYWKSVKGREMVASGTVLDVKSPSKFDQLRGKGATISLLNENRPAVKGVNIVLDITDLASAADLKRNDVVKFSGGLDDYRGGRDPGTRLSLVNAKILESHAGAPPPPIQTRSAGTQPHTGTTAAGTTGKGTGATEHQPRQQAQEARVSASTGSNTSRQEKAAQGTNPSTEQSGESFGSGLKERFVNGNTSVTKLSAKKFAIVVEPTFFTSSDTKMYELFEAAAMKACPGGYRTISQQVVTKDYKQPKLQGMIECE